jgi:hypothetical protein
MTQGLLATKDPIKILSAILPIIELHSQGDYAISHATLHPRQKNGQLITEDQLRIEPRILNHGTIVITTCATPDVLLVRAKQGPATKMMDKVIEECKSIFPHVKFIYNQMSKRCHD